MARNFRYYEKKRGNRRTGSRTIGTVGEAVFFSVLLIVGCAGMVGGVLSLVIPEWRVNHGFVEQTCTVLHKQLGQKDGDSGPVFRPELKIEYQVRGITYRPVAYDIHNAYWSGRDEAQAVLDRFAEHQKYPCWYDPGNPDVAVLVRGYQWWIWLVFLIPLSFIVIGAGGLIYSILHWGGSVERRAAMARRAQTQELFEVVTAGDSTFPNVPSSSEIDSSPGTRLAYRLPLSRSPGWALFGLLAACVAWNGAVSYFAVTAVRGHLEGRPDWLLTLFNLPFLAIGIALVFVLIRQLRVAMGIGPTLVEISNHPLAPGGQYRLVLSQSGRLTARSLELSLVCEEEATYRQGTNTRNETREVYRQTLLHCDGFQVRQGEPFDTECALGMPAEAMHSFKASNNQIRWKLVVQADFVHWPRFRRDFPVIVHPAARPSGLGSDAS